MKLSELDQADLKFQTVNMYNTGGIANVIECLATMEECQLIIMQKLNEIILSESK